MSIKHFTLGLRTKSKGEELCVTTSLVGTTFLPSWRIRGELRVSLLGTGPGTGLVSVHVPFSVASFVTS